MSNTLAIAAVTKTLAALITPALADVSGAVAVPGRPDETPPNVEAEHVRIFLYRVEPNAAWRNCDLPTRRSDGTLAQRPQAALDLSYLLSFYGPEHLLVPHRLLASTVLVLHEQPLLSREVIQAAVGDGNDDSLADADLASQPELIRLTPLSLSLDDLTKLWSVFSETPYQLSVAYEASVVLLNSEEVPSRPLPVRKPRIYAITLRRPHITHIVNAQNALLPITAGATIYILGNQLRGEITQVRLIGKARDAATGESRTHEWTGPEWHVPPRVPDVLPDNGIELTLPDEFMTGLVSAQVLHQMTMGEPSDQRPSAASNLAPLLLQPSILRENGGFAVSLVTPAVCAVVPDTDPEQQICSGQLQITIAPEVASAQQVHVLLNRIQPAAPAATYGFSGTLAPAEPDEPAEPGTRLLFDFKDVSPGTYLVRVQIDGIDSPLIVDEESEGYAEPMVAIP
jgi:hypothetical protein